MISERAKVHGLDGGWAAPDWAALTLDELRNLFAQFSILGEPIEIVFASPRPLSAAAVARTPRGDYFVKRHAKTVRDPRGLLEEHGFMLELLARGVPVPRLVTDETGNSVIEIADSTYEVHELASGIDVYAEAISWTPFLSAAHAYQAGRALARLHLAASGFEAPRRKVQPLVSSFTIFADADAPVVMKRYIDVRPALASYPGIQQCAENALGLLKTYHSELLPLLPYLDPLWTHNDLHASNLFWSGAGDSAQVTTVIDFGLSDRTNAVHDLAIAIERNVIDWLALAQHPEAPCDVRFHGEHLEAILNGYESVRQLSDSEAAALAPMMALCHAEFALSEADYFLGVLRSEENARKALDGYLIGHARWFQSRPGTRLLDTIRLWVDSRGKDRGECLQ